jgi:isocitrate lyase
MSSRKEKIKQLEQEWSKNPRWSGLVRPYSAENVVNLSGSVSIEHTISKNGSNKLWDLLHMEPYIKSLGAITGGQAMQQVKAGIKAIYLSGWQVAADGNTSNTMYPDQSLYPIDSVPRMCERINNTLQSADRDQWSKGIDYESDNYIDYFVPIIADADAGFGGVLNAFELTKLFIKAGASAVHLEDQLSSAKKCGHLGGKVLVPTKEAIEKLVSARLASDVMGVPLLIVARTDAEAADLITSDYDEDDKYFLTGERTHDGFYKTKNGLEQAISRGLAYAPYADMIWCETGKPDLEFARQFSEAILEKFPGKLLAYNCSPSFNWKKNLSDEQIALFQKELSILGYKYQFITLAGIHSMWYNMFDLAKDYMERGMTAYVEKVQEPEFNARNKGYTFVSHQQEVGTGYFDNVANVVQGGLSSTTALKGSTEKEQF